jgi:hypothetical protein
LVPFVKPSTPWSTTETEFDGLKTEDAFGTADIAELARRRFENDRRLWDPSLAMQSPNRKAFSSAILRPDRKALVSTTRSGSGIRFAMLQEEASGRSTARTAACGGRDWVR